jgi:hypothetical protein
MLVTEKIAATSKYCTVRKVLTRDTVLIVGAEDPQSAAKTLESSIRTFTDGPIKIVVNRIFTRPHRGRRILRKAGCGDLSQENLREEMISPPSSSAPALGYPSPPKPTGVRSRA